MSYSKHKVFISHHHDNDQAYKEALLKLNNVHGIFVDMSVDTGDIDENLNDQRIREKIRDEYLRDSTVTIVLVGTETKNRKHVDWEIYSSMYDGTVNKKSGVLVVNLPSTGCTYYTVAHGDAEKSMVYPENTNWTTIDDRAVYHSRYPYMPDRIIDNLLEKAAKVSVTSWDRVAGDVEKLQFLINETAKDRAGSNYDLSRDMKRTNS